MKRTHLVLDERLLAQATQVLAAKTYSAAVNTATAANDSGRQQSDAFRAASGEIYRQGRRRGLPIRSSVDCLIAAIAIDRRIPVWHRDRGFSAIARYTALECNV